MRTEKPAGVRARLHDEQQQQVKEMYRTLKKPGRLREQDEHRKEYTPQKNY